MSSTQQRLSGIPGLDSRITRAIDQLTRCQRHVKAGVIEPTFADAKEFVDLVFAVSTLEAATVEAWIADVDAYVKRVCPAVAGGQS